MSDQSPHMHMRPEVVARTVERAGKRLGQLQAAAAAVERRLVELEKRIAALEEAQPK